MKRVKIFRLDGKSKGTIATPKVFETPLRGDVIRRAVVAQQTHRMQPQGRNPMAGKRTTAESYGVGRGLARIPRVRGERHRKAGQAAFAPGTVGGRLAHPPTVDKVFRKKINRKERLLALRSAIAATADRDAVIRRGHILDSKKILPLVVSDELETINRTGEAVKVLESIGVDGDIERVKNSVKERPGKGKKRGRRLKHAVGPLIVVSDGKGVSRALRNLLGVDVVKIRNLSVENLAPGTHPGRLTIWSESAVKSLDEIFMGKVKTFA